jgi:hypothetical protein
MDPLINQLPTTTTTEVTKVEQVSTVPKGFWLKVGEDIHANLSGIVMFSFAASAVVWPQYKDKFNEIAALAGTYLFAYTKGRNKNESSN